MYKQIIIARKDLHMSPGKLAAQVSHASMAFLTAQIRGTYTEVLDCECEKKSHIESRLSFDNELFNGWFLGAFTKCVLQAKNRNQLLKAVSLAESLSMKEGIDFFLIKDNCYTELTPEEVDENGVGRTLTCIGFKPMDAEIIDQIGKKYHIYEGG